MSAASQTALPRVAVLLATRNGLCWLPEQVQSILAQAGVAVTLAVADDASTDATWAWLQENLGGLTGVTLMHYAQGSGSAGANFRRLLVEAELSDAEYVAFADQDDLWAPLKLQRAVDRLTATGAGGYSSTAQAFWPDGRTQALSQSPRMRSADFLFEGAGQGCTFVLDRPLFDNVRAFCRDHRPEVEALHYHDWLIYLLARAWETGWVFDAKSAIQYRQHDSNEIGARSGQGAFERRLGLIRNGWFLRQVKAASQLYLLAGGRDPKARSLARRFLGGGRSVVRRPTLAWSVFRLGRRRASDRLALALAALAGWI